MEVFLDTNFIISCVKKRIDFIDELLMQGFRIIVPREVIQELKDLRLNVAHTDRVAIDVALKMFIGKRIEKGKLGGKTVDEGLIAKGKQGAYIATLDAAIKRAVSNRVVISDATRNVSIERS